MVTSVYKIITKVLSWCLKKLSFQSQGAFVEGRQILVTVLVANEAVGEKTRSGEEGLAFKIAFEKAYDYVDRGFFLDHVLERKSFSTKGRMDKELLVDETVSYLKLLWFFAKP